MDLYFSGFKPLVSGSKPHATLCVWALAANTHEEALHQFNGRARWKLDRNTGKIGPLLSPEEAAASFTDVEWSVVKAMQEKALIGTPQSVAQRLEALAARHGLDEIVVITWAHDPQVQEQSYTLLAQEMGLMGQPLASPRLAA